MLLPGTPRVKFELPCMVGIAECKSGVAPGLLWGAVLDIARWSNISTDPMQSQGQEINNLVHEICFVWPSSSNLIGSLFKSVVVVHQTIIFHSLKTRPYTPLCMGYLCAGLL